MSGREMAFHGITLTRRIAQEELIHGLATSSAEFFIAFAKPLPGGLANRRIKIDDERQPFVHHCG